jgi:hypothetical protein
MYLDDEAICPCSHGRLGNGCDQLPFACAMAWIDDDGQMG